MNNEKLKLWALSVQPDSPKYLFVAEDVTVALREAEEYDSSLFGDEIAFVEEIKNVDLSGLENGYLDSKLAQEKGLL